MFLNSTPASISWARPKSMSLILGSGTFLSSSMMFSGCRQDVYRLIQASTSSRDVSQSELTTFTRTSRAKVAATALTRTNLEVEVSDFPGVEVVDALQDLLDELSGLLLAQRLLLGQKVKQLTARDATRERESARADEAAAKINLLSL